MHFTLTSFYKLPRQLIFFCFFFTAPAPPEIYTLSLHDALPISTDRHLVTPRPHRLRSLLRSPRRRGERSRLRDRKSTRLNSSHVSISYAVFCLKKKKKKNSERMPYA